MYFNELGITLQATKTNLIDKLWTNKPQMEMNPIFFHEKKYAGESIMSKLKRTASFMKNKYLFLQNMDEIAWLLNLRGSDIVHSPLFCSYMILEFNFGRFVKGTLYIHTEKVPEEIEDYLEKLNISIDEYE